jgi:hypothetical protein
LARETVKCIWNSTSPGDDYEDEYTAIILAALNRARVEKSDRCTWPGCGQPAFCASGNFGNQLVCAWHFKLTNGLPAEEVGTRHGVVQILKEETVKGGEDK